MLQDREGRGYDALNKQAWALIAKANAEKGLHQVYTLFDVGTPRVWADVDRRKADLLGVPPERIFEALQVYLGSAFVNDFNLLGRTYRVTAQADQASRERLPTLPI
jgi:multidrug efflux pump subunit AcrB